MNDDGRRAGAYDVSPGRSRRPAAGSRRGPVPAPSRQSSPRSGGLAALWRLPPVRIPTMTGFYRWLAIAAGIGLVIRLAFVLFLHPGVPLAGDPWYYNWQAYYLTQGRGFLDPASFIFLGKTFPAADHPPMTTLVLATSDMYHLGSYQAHQIVYCFIGTATVAMTGLAAREIAGDRAARLAAFIAACYPGLWINDGLVQSETIAQLLVVITIFLGFRFWKRPSMYLSVALGTSIALWVLTRSEDALIILLVFAPLMYGARDPMEARGPVAALDSRAWGLTITPMRDTGGMSRVAGRLWRAATSWGTSEARDPRPLLPTRRRAALAAGGIAAMVVLIAPWSYFSMTAFAHPEVISTQLGRTLVGANCATTYNGDLTGYWDYNCQMAHSPPLGSDGSVSDAFFRHEAIHYAFGHTSRWVPVVYARLGRVWGFYNPVQNLQVDSQLLDRPYWASLIQLIMYYVMIVPALAALAMLHRRRVAIAPLLGPILSVTLVTIVTYGTTRFRAPAEPCIVILFAIGEAGWGRRIADTRSSTGRGLRARFQALIGMPEGDTVSAESHGSA